MTSQDTLRLQFLWNASHTLLPSTPNLSALYMQRFHQHATEKMLKLADGVKRKYCSYCGSIFIPGINCQSRINASRKRKKQKKKQKANVEDQLPKKARQHKVIQDDDLGTYKRQKVTQEKRKIIHFQSDNTSQQKDPKRKRLQYKNHLSYICEMCNRETRFTGCITRDTSRSDQTEVNKSKTSLSEKPRETLTSSEKLISPKSLSSGSKSKKKKQKSQLQQFLAEEREKTNAEKKDPTELLNLEDFLSSL